MIVEGVVYIRCCVLMANSFLYFLLLVFRIITHLPVNVNVHLLLGVP
jgi:hypothetical protein